VATWSIRFSPNRLHDSRTHCSVTDCPSSEQESRIIVLPRDAMQKRSLLFIEYANNAVCPHAVSVCLSVCLSVKFVDSVKTSNRILIFVPLLGSHTILVFPYQTSWHYSDGDPPNGGVECKGVWKNDDFRPISRFISELMQYRAIVTMEGEYETAPKLSNGTSLNDLKWPLTQISTSRLFNGK